MKKNITKYHQCSDPKNIFEGWQYLQASKGSNLCCIANITDAV